MLRLVPWTLLALTAPGAALLPAQTIFVDTTADVVDFGGGQTVADLPGLDGKVSLREALTAANKTAGPQTVGFHVPVAGWGASHAGPVLLNTGVSFPITGDDTTVDGSTQTAFTGDSNPEGAEVSFHSPVIDVELIQSGTFAVASARNRFVALGDMTGRNYGIDLLPTATENTVTACVVRGVFAAVRVQGDRNVIGGTTSGSGNSLESLSDGLRIQGLSADPAQDNVVVGNRLTGGFNGVQIVGNASGNRIGGTAPGEANVIARAGYLQEDGTPDGAMIRIESHGNLVLGNFVGTRFGGTAVDDNLGDVGIEIYGDDNVIRRNVVGGITGLAGPFSVQAGIHLREGAERNVIQGNWIGVDRSGTIPLPNGVGIQIAAFAEPGLPAPGDNVIGGLAPGEGNVIAHNEQGGVRILLETSGNTLSGNELRDNHAAGALGIDLGGDGPTPNDPFDVDVGPNQLLNAPRLLRAVDNGQRTVVLGELDTPNPTTVRVELFANPPPAPGEVVEAQHLLGAGHPLGDGSFRLVVAGGTAGLVLSATATDAAGNTSEISRAILVQPASLVARAKMLGSPFDRAAKWLLGTPRD